MPNQTFPKQSRFQKKIFNTLKLLAESIDPVRSASLACAVVRKNEIIAVGYNSLKSHPFQQKFSKNSSAIYLHAETSAIKNALKRIPVKELEKCSIYVLRIRKDGSCGNSKPCSGCRRAINTFGIHSVYYTLDNKEGFHDV